MGNNQSSAPKSKGREKPFVMKEGGQKSKANAVEEYEETHSTHLEEEISDEEYDSVSSSDEDYDSDDEELDEDERHRILEEARLLKKYAEFYLHPEKPVEGNTSTRCYFDRPSAPEQLSFEEAEERARILEDAKALKQLAINYLHPEIPVKTTDPYACGRNYFDRPSAPEQLSFEEAEERVRILEDAKALKKLAVDYLHPEIPVKTTDPYACGRNYFDRPSAPEQLSWEEAEERVRILEDAKALKKLAVDYLHPELPVKTTDPFACGRNYFDRPSAPEQLSYEEAEERARILEDAKALKKLAIQYRHPEIPVQTTDPFACGRNYFERPSAPERLTYEEAEERVRILEDAKALKELAVQYRHPEIPVKTTDPFAYGRNYFERASAPEQLSFEEAEERVRILEDAKALKKLAVDYLHPELPVKTTDPYACGRNYFDRPSAPGHLEHIHTYPAHDDDIHNDHEHLEHFDMHEEMDYAFDDLRKDFDAPTGEVDLKEGEGGNLSRSPSSVMLAFEEA